MKRKVSRQQATLEIIPLVDYYVANTIKLFREHTNNIEYSEDVFKTICYAYYIDCVKYSLSIDQKLENDKCNEIIVPIIEDVADIVYEGDKISHDLLYRLCGEYIQEVVDVFYSYKEFEILLKEIKDMIYDYENEEDVNEAKQTANVIFEKLGKDLILAIKKEYKIDRK